MSIENILKLVSRVTWLWKDNLPKIAPLTIRTIDGRYAYICLNEACQKISETAPHEVCEGCGQKCIWPVQRLLAVSCIDEARARKRKEQQGKIKPINAQQAMQANRDAYLTAPEETPTVASSRRKENN